MAIISLTQKESGLSFSINEDKIIKVTDYLVDGVTEGLLEYSEQRDGLKKTVVIDEDVTAVTALASRIIPVTLFDNSEVVLINSGRVSTTEDAISRKDGTTTVGHIRYNASGATDATIETVELQAALDALIDVAIVL